MKKETSAGCIIINDNKVLLVYEIHGGFWGFPKGHLEKGETLVDAALREVKEETNLDVKIDTSVRFVTNYIVDGNIDKTSVFYKASLIGGTLQKQDSEILNIKWATKEEALSLVKFDNLKNIINEVM